eukprot:scaffold162812_cov14-Tisochrysis_lutea.AAC.1
MGIWRESLATEAPENHIPVYWESVPELLHGVSYTSVENRSLEPIQFNWYWSLCTSLQSSHPLQQPSCTQKFLCSYLPQFQENLLLDRTHKALPRMAYIVFMASTEHAFS